MGGTWGSSSSFSLVTTTIMGVCDRGRAWEEVVRRTVVRSAAFIAGRNVAGGDGVIGVLEVSSVPTGPIPES